MKKTITMVAFMLPCLLLANSIKSNNNLLFSYYKPSKILFIKNAKNNYLTNDRLKEVYSNPFGTPENSLIYAVAMDSVYTDGSDIVKTAYESAAFSIKGAYSYISILHYADFLIRTKRYSDLNEITPEMCGRDAPQCAYYKLVAKHLENKNILLDECKDSMKFLPMRKMVLRICKKIPNFR